MIRETLSKIENKLQNASGVSESTRAELVALLGTLKAEVTELSRTDAETARNIAGLAATSTTEAIREAKDPELLDLSLRDLAASVEGFEQSHPGLVQIVNRISTTLANLGI